MKRFDGEKYLLPHELDTNEKKEKSLHFLEEGYDWDVLNPEEDYEFWKDPRNR